MGEGAGFDYASGCRLVNLLLQLKLIVDVPYFDHTRAFGRFSRQHHFAIALELFPLA